MEEILQIISGSTDSWDAFHSIPISIGFVALIIILIIIKKRVDKKRHEAMYAKMKDSKGKSMDEIMREINDQFNSNTGKK